MPVVIDTSALYALIDRGERQHAAVFTALSSERESIVLPQTVLTESCYLIASRLGPVVEREFLRGLLDSDWRTEAVTAADLERTVELLATYADADLGLVDASVVATAERLGASRLYTLDQRDFRLVRPRQAADRASRRPCHPHRHPPAATTSGALEPCHVPAAARAASFVWNCSRCWGGISG